MTEERTEYDPPEQTQEALPAVIEDKIDGPLSGFAVAAKTSEQAWELCCRIAKSPMIPKAFFDKPNDIFVVSSMGARLGLDPFASMAGIASINGRPTIYGDMMVAICMNHPDFRDTQESFTGEDDLLTAHCVVVRGDRSPIECTFSVQEAKIAKLWGKPGPWTQFPRRMLMWRAKSYAYRTAFADILAGYHTREEMEDVRPVRGVVSGRVEVE